MNENIENNKYIENKIDSKSNNNNSRVISSFEGLEEDFNKFLNSLEEEKLNSKVIKNILHVFPQQGKLYSMLEKAIGLNNMHSKIKYEMGFLSDEFKKQAHALITAWNAVHSDQQISSIRFVSKKSAKGVLVSKRKAYSISNKNKVLQEIKNNESIKKIFIVNKHLILKENMKNVLFEILKSTIGEDFIYSFFEEEVDIKVDHDKLMSVLADNNVPETDKNLIKEMVKKHEYSVKYGK